MGLRRDGVYIGQPGWRTHIVRLAVACVAMVAVIVLGLLVWPDWSAWTTWLRVERLSILIAGAGGAFVLVLFACGFRLRELRAH
jgi:putative peptidoglycan lipid II flippase